MEESDNGEWRQADANDKGYAHLGDAEIISQVMSPHSLDTDDVTETMHEPEVGQLHSLGYSSKMKLVCTTYPCWK